MASLLYQGNACLLLLFMVVASTALIGYSIVDGGPDVKRHSNILSIYCLTKCPSCGIILICYGK